MSMKSKLMKFQGRARDVKIGDETFVVHPMTLHDQAELEALQDSQSKYTAALLWVSLRKEDPSLTLDDVLALDGNALLELKPLLVAIGEINGIRDSAKLFQQFEDIVRQRAAQAVA